MKLNFISKTCPACKAAIRMGLFSGSGEILRCPHCKELLIESPKRKLLAAIILSLGIFIGIGSPALFGISSVWGILIFALSILIALTVRTLVVIKKDLVIKHKSTNAISYIDNQDWNEILKNTRGNEISFEIIEELK